MAKWDLGKGKELATEAVDPLDVVTWITPKRLEQLQDEIKTLHSKNSRQRNEIARLNQKLECVTKEKLSLLSDIKFLRGEKQ